jgi:hypothetical protein
MKQDEHTAVQRHGVMMVMKWMDKNSVSFNFTFHSGTMVTVSNRGKDGISYSRCIKEYNSYMGGVSMKNQELQAYESWKK